jgi:hypothetical protein
MFSKRESDLRFRLAGPEVQVIEVIGNWHVQRRQRCVDQEMVMPGIRLCDTGRCYAHIDKTEPDDRRLG